MAGSYTRIVLFSDRSEPMIAAADVAGLLRATRYWRSETRKLLLRVGDHRVRMGVVELEIPHALVGVHVADFDQEVA